MEITETWKTIPSLSYCVTERCNLKCSYCTPYGDAILPGTASIYKSTKRLSIDKVAKVFKSFVDIGATTFRITGGEPLYVFPNIKELMGEIQDIPGSHNLRIRLNTNGVLLKKYAQDLLDLKFNCVKVSLDTLDPKRYESITKRAKLDDVLDGIQEALSLEIPLELNMVLMKDTREDFWQILDYCIRNKVSILKVLDLYLIEDKKYWFENYESPSSLIADLTRLFGQPELSLLTHNRGSPMLSFKASEHTKVLVKDCGQGTTYSTLICTSCTLFPCQNGILTVTLTSNGFISPCHLRPDLAIDIRDKCLKAISRGEIFTELVDRIRDEVSKPFSSVFLSTIFFESISK